MNLVETNKGDVVITLKEITDLIAVQHSKAMKKVAKLAEEPSFGWVAKMDSQYESGKGRVETIETYGFTKYQAIAVGAKLNNKLLMKVIDRLEELESAKPKAPVLPATYIEALEAHIQTVKELAIANQVVELHNDLTHQDKDTMNFMSLGEVAKELGYMLKQSYLYEKG